MTDFSKVDGRENVSIQLLNLQELSFIDYRAKSYL